MGNTTGIEWTDATWNPTVGCTKVSAGCDHCYAETLVNRFAGHNSGFPNRFDTMTLRGDKTLFAPLRWRIPKRIFVNSLSDLFHDDVPADFIARVFAVVTVAKQHSFQLLTKRHARMRSLLNDPVFWRAVRRSLHTEHGWDEVTAFGSHLFPPRNLWLGVSVENQQWADIRIPALLDTPAAVRFLSCEPLLGPVDLRPAWVEEQRRVRGLAPAVGGTGAPWPHAIDWVIVGGESGRDARPMRVDWPRRIRNQCAAAGVPFLFKQWGEYAPYNQMTDAGRRLVEDRARSIPAQDDVIEQRYIHRVGKKAAGRKLDERTWDEYPTSVTRG